MNQIFTSVANLFNPVLPPSFVIQERCPLSGNEKGAAHEEMVGKALERIVENEVCIYNTPKVVGFVHSKQYSADDRSGADFRLHFSCGMCMPLQVKSSELGRKRFASQNRAHNSYIPVVVVRGIETTEELVNKLIGLLREAYKKLSRIRNKIRYTERRRSSKDRFFRIHSPCMCH